MFLSQVSLAVFWDRDHVYRVGALSTHQVLFLDRVTSVTWQIIVAWSRVPSLVIFP